jgi:hypothetical protein
LLAQLFGSHASMHRPPSPRVSHTPGWQRAIGFAHAGGARQALDSSIGFPDGQDGWLSAAGVELPKEACRYP